MAPVVAGVVVGAEVAVPDGGKYVVVPLDELWATGSSAMAAGATPAQQTPNKLTPRRRRAESLIIPRLAPIGEGCDMPAFPALREPSSWRKNA